MTVLINGTNGLIQAYDYQAPTTGFSYVFAAGTQTLVMNPAGTLATGTITMPASPSDGMTITFTTTQQITALTLSGNAGQTIIGGVNTLGAEQSLSFIYRAANTTWFPMTTQVAQGTGPAFSAYQSGSTTLSNTVFTKILVATEEFDTNNNFASSTFTPTVAGYYQVSGVISTNSTATAGSIILSAIFKNGSRFKDGSMGPINNAQGGWSSASCLVYLNGSTDYIEFYGYMAGPATLTTQTAVHATYFQAALVRAA